MKNHHSSYQFFRVLTGVIVMLVAFACLKPVNSQDGGTFLPSGDLAVITAENLDQLTWIGRLGQGTQTPVVSWSPDSQHFALPGTMGIWLYDINNPQVAPRLFESPEGEITCLTFSPDGRWLVAGRKNGTLAIWDTMAITNFAFSTLVNTTPNPIYLIAFNPDMTTLTSVNLYDSITLWDISQGLDQGRIKNTVTFGDERFYALSPDGLQFFSEYDEWENNERVTILRRRNLLGEENRWEFDLNAAQINYLERVLFSPNGELMVMIYSRRDQGDLIQLWDNRENEPVMIGETISVYGERRYIYDLVFTPDGQQLVSVSDGFFGYRTHVRDVSRVFTDGSASVVEVGNILEREFSYGTMRFSPDGKWLAANVLYHQPDYQGQLEIWDWPSREIIWQLSMSESSIAGNRISFSANSQTLLTWGVSHQPSLHLFDLASGAELLSAETGTLNAVHPTNTFFLGDTSLWQINATDHSFDRLVNLNYTNSAQVEFSFSADGNHFVTPRYDSYSRNYKFQIWDFETQVIIGEYEYQRANLKTLKLSPDGNILAVGYEIYNDPRKVDLLDADTGRIMLSLPTPNGRLEGIFFKPTGEILVTVQSVADGYVITLWDVKNSLLGQQGLTLSTIHLSLAENSYSVLPQIAFSPDGNLLAVNDPAQGILFWETATLNNSSENPMPVFSLPTYNRAISALNFSPDGKWLASLSGEYGAVWLWGVPMEK